MGSCTSAPHEKKPITSCQDISKGVIFANANKEMAISPAESTKMNPTKRNDNNYLNTNPIYPPYLFFTNLTFHNKQKLHSLIAAYCQQIVSCYDHIQIPTDIISLFVSFYQIQKNEAPPLPRFVRWRNNEIMYIYDNNEHIYNKFCLWETDFIRISNDMNADTLKITVYNDLVLKEGSKIIGSNKGNIILNVMGDLEIGNNAQIICSNGNIFIKSKNLILHSFANIRTYKKCKYNTLNEANCSTLYGNIYMEIEEDVIINNNAQIKSGDINIKCGGCIRNDDDIDIVMIVLRNHLTINSGKFRIKQRNKLQQKQNKLVNYIL